MQRALLQLLEAGFNPHEDNSVLEAELYGEEKLKVAPQSSFTKYKSRIKIDVVVSFSNYVLRFHIAISLKLFLFT